MSVSSSIPWAMPAERSARLQIAKTYPYDAPAVSYLFRDGGVHPIADADFRGRTAVIGHGSNRAPQQLARKFSHLGGRDSEIPVTYVWLHDYDVVYSAHVTAYGAVASTLQAVPGCRVRVALTWLDDVQLQRMHETEGNYSYGSLAGVRLEAEAGPDIHGGEVTMYLSDHGCLSDGGRPVGLAAVPGEGRPHRALWQAEIHEEIHRRMASDLHLDDFILEAVADKDTRWNRIARLRQDAVPADVPHFRVL